MTMEDGLLESALTSTSWKKTEN